MFGGDAGLLVSNMDSIHQWRTNSISKTPCHVTQAAFEVKNPEKYPSSPHAYLLQTTKHIDKYHMKKYKTVTKGAMNGYYRQTTTYTC